MRADGRRRAAPRPPRVEAARRAYLDDAGAAPILPEAAAARAAAPPGNPASPHFEGRAARAALDAARDRAGRALGVPAEGIVFCASGTEAVNLALLGAGRRLDRDRSIATWAIEHQSVLAALRQLQLEGRRVHVLPVDSRGFARSQPLPADAGLVSLGLANNEVGTIQPVVEVARRARQAGALVHLDCCQGPRWISPPLHLADLASFSGLKLGSGPGGLLFAPPELILDPLVHGGPQERGRRAGTEDVADAAALAAALEVCALERASRSAAVRPLAARLRAFLASSGARLTGGEPRLPGFATAAFGGVRGEDLLMALDLAGISASSGSACASGSLDPSHVLLAMGLSLDEALGSLRLTLGYATTADEVERAMEILAGVLRRLAAGASSPEGAGNAPPSR
jgi:cysteine desulfurase